MNYWKNIWVIKINKIKANLQGEYYLKMFKHCNGLFWPRVYEGGGEEAR